MKATLVVKAGLTDRKEYLVDKARTYLVGRSREADIIVKDKLASRNHCKIVGGSGDEWTVADLGSSNGTYVNRQRVTAHTLRDGDLVQVGRAALEFRVVRDAPAPGEGRAEPPQAGAVRPEAADRPVGAASSQAQEPAAAASAADASPAPAPPAGEQLGDDDIRGLFEFLDRIDARDRPAAQEEPERGDADREPSDSSVLFALFNEASQPGPEPKKPKPTAPGPEEEGGLLDFLRKKKPS